MPKVTKAVILAAGLGTRFLPQTKAMPKEMLPIIDKPIIQYVVEEVVAAGVTDIIIVTGANKRSIEDHFDHQYDLENKLDQSGKKQIADRMRHIADMANFIYVRQKGLPGTGTPVLNAAPLLNDEPFLVMYADDIFQSEVPRSVQLVQAYEKLNAPVISLIPIKKERAPSYGVVSIKERLDDELFLIDGLIEKPAVEEAPSTYASVGGYILDGTVIEILKHAKTGVGGELWLSSAIGQLSETEKVYGRVINGEWHDTGNKEKYLEAIIGYALADPDMGEDFRTYLQSRLNEGK